MELLQGELTHQKQPRIVESIVLLFLISVGFTSGSTAITGPEKVKGVVGQSVTVECRYEHEYKDYVKKWCRGDPSVSCDALVSTEKPQHGRVSMNDNKSQGIISVTMDNLKMSDKGLYQCMIQRAIVIPNDRFTISLEVSEAPEKEATTLEISTEIMWTTSPQNWMSTRKQPRIVESIVLLFLISVGFTSGSTALTGPEQVRGVVGESVTLECQYDQKYKDYVKKWCRRDPDVGCKDLVSTEKPQNGRVSMTDNKTQGIFSVTMDNLKNSDEGLYQCMIQKANENFTISLEIPEGLTGPEKVRGVVGQSVTVECQYEHEYRDNVKKWCKGVTFVGCDALVSTEKPQNGRVSITDKKTQGIFSVTMDNLMKSDEGLYQCMIERAFYTWNKRFTISLEVSEAPEKEATTLEISTEIMWTTSPQNWMSTKKAESTETSVSSHPIRNTERKIHYVWALTRWILFGVLVLSTVSTSCMTAFQR
ncbi:polymeric immunoglobulin receptor-like [Hemitrygon akajei]|uniref:polymeric immunoglobulin receptor-like n=1 Tax=Hemitrygon akajei TaxID=2704970 RepID=UPI003BF98986